MKCTPQVVLTRGGQGITVILLNRGQDAVVQPVQVNSYSYSGNRYPGQMYVFGVRPAGAQAPTSSSCVSFCSCVPSMSKKNRILYFYKKTFFIFFLSRELISHDWPVLSMQLPAQQPRASPPSPEAGEEGVESALACQPLLDVRVWCPARTCNRCLGSVPPGLAG